MQDKNPNSVLAYLVGDLCVELSSRRLGKDYEDYVKQFISEAYCYARDNCIFKDNPNNKFATCQDYFVQKSKDVTKLLENLDEKRFCNCSGHEIQEVLNAFSQGTYTSQTVMDYTLWLLNFSFEQPELGRDIEYVFRVFVIYLREFLHPRPYIQAKKTNTHNSWLSTFKHIVRYPLRIAGSVLPGKVTKVTEATLNLPEDTIRNYLNKKSTAHTEEQNNIPLGFAQHPIISCLDDIIEEHIEAVQPSLYFFDELKRIKQEAVNDSRHINSS